MINIDNKHSIEFASIEPSAEGALLVCAGDWTAGGIAMLDGLIEKLRLPAQASVTVDGSQIVQLDSSGAWLLHKLCQRVEDRQSQIQWQGFDTERSNLIALVTRHAQRIAESGKPALPGWFAQLGKGAVQALEQILHVFAFIGETAIYMMRAFLNPLRIQWRQLLGAVETSGYQALPIIALLTFLIGVVLAYQMGQQLRNYGANIYIVDLLGISMLREFGPLIAAIIIAGRTGAAFTAQIGTMKVNEEIDALRTMGVSPTEMLILPKMFGLLIALPLLTIWADIFGVFGGMVISKGMLSIGFTNFLERFQDAISFRTYWLGMVKVPVFALIISGVGCYHGFQVQGDADSVGHETTRSVVHSIFLIIVADAIFSVMFGWSDM